MFKNLITTNPVTTICIVVVIGLLLTFYGCESKVTSLLNPTEQINRQQLEGEVETFLGRAEYKFNSLNQQDKLRELLLEHSILSLQSGQIDFVGIFTALGSILGVGAIADNVRLRRKHNLETVTYEPVLENVNENSPPTA